MSVSQFRPIGHRPKGLAATALVLTVSLATAGCGSSSSASGPSSGSATGEVPVAVGATPTKTTYPLTIENCGQKVTFDGPPKRVLVMNGASVGEVETYVLLGLQDHILANAQHVVVSDDPMMVAEVAKLPTGGTKWNKNFDVPAEQALALKPDLVVSTWSGGFAAKSGFATREQLAAAGINSFVNPVDCAYGATDPSKADQDVYDHQSIASTYAFITQTGEIFDVQQRAANVVAKLRARVTAVQARVAGQAPKKVLIAFPGMAMMSANSLPAVFSGGVYDDIIRAAGGENAFPSSKPNPELTSNLSPEALASAHVDVLVIGLFELSEAGGRAKQYAEQLFTRYPQWQASKTKTFVVVSDSAFIGPTNAYAVEKIADAAHPQ